MGSRDWGGHNKKCAVMNGIAQRVPILVYHHVYADDEVVHAGAAPGVIALTEFVRQMHWVRDTDWTVVSTSNLVDWLTNDSTLPKHACVIHFDNGWLDTYAVALPVLADLGFLATCYPITSGVEAASINRSARVRTLTEGWVEKPFMSWDKLGALREAGWDIGAHTHTHCKIADEYETEGDNGVLGEMIAANECFMKRLGLVPEHFAYPSGSRNDRTDRLLANVYRSIRLWHWEWPIRWTFTDRNTSVCGIHSQNIDTRVTFADFQRVFEEAAAI